MHEMEKFGLAIVEFMKLRKSFRRQHVDLLIKISQREGITSAELTKLTGISQSSVSKTIDIYADELGLVRVSKYKMPYKHYLTAKGRAFMLKINEIMS